MRRWYGGALAGLEAEAREATECAREVLDRAEEACLRIGRRRFAKRARGDAANLAHELSGRRKPSQLMLEKLQASLSRGS